MMLSQMSKTKYKLDSDFQINRK